MESKKVSIVMGVDDTSVYNTREHFTSPSEWQPYGWAAEGHPSNDLKVWVLLHSFPVQIQWEGRCLQDTSEHT